MNKNENMSQYTRIALSIASRIDSGDLKEGQRISGRSVLASEYGVSPETIRRSLKLLSDMKVVEIKDKSGVTVISKDNASRYLQIYDGVNQRFSLQSELRELYSQYTDVGRRMLDIYGEILKTQSVPLPEDKTLPNYEVRVSEGSHLIGKSIGSVRFWQATGATIVAIKRGQNSIISPGPYAEIYGGDVIVFVCPNDIVSAVDNYVNHMPSGDD